MPSLPTRIIASVIACVGFALASTAFAQIVGNDSALTVGGRTYRLWGLVVPGPATACIGDWNAARAARKHLDQLVNGRVVDCEYRGKGADGIDLAVCRADGKDIGADLVRAGLAWSNGNQSRDYVVDEGFAMSGVRGVHARVCRLPPVLLSRPRVSPQ